MTGEIFSRACNSHEAEGRGGPEAPLGGAHHPHDRRGFERLAGLADAEVPAVRTARIAGQKSMVSSLFQSVFLVDFRFYMHII